MRRGKKTDSLTPVHSSDGHLKLPSLIFSILFNGDWFIIFCLASTIKGYCPTRYWNSFRRSFVIVNTPLQRRSTAPLAHGQCEVLNWLRMCASLVKLVITIAMKSDPWSITNNFIQPNDAIFFYITIFPASLSTLSQVQYHVYDLWQSLIIILHFSPRPSAGPLYKKSAWTTSLRLVQWIAMDRVRGLRSLVRYTKQWMRNCIDSLISFNDCSVWGTWCCPSVPIESRNFLKLSSWVSIYFRSSCLYVCKHVAYPSTGLMKDPKLQKCMAHIWTLDKTYLGEFGHRAKAWERTRESCYQ